MPQKDYEKTTNKPSTARIPTKNHPKAIFGNRVQTFSYAIIL